MPEPDDVIDLARIEEYEYLINRIRDACDDWEEPSGGATVEQYDARIAVLRAALRILESRPDGGGGPT
jgi:hypothetical protein